MNVRTLSPRRRAFWSDARFFLGLALVAAAVAGVWAVVAAARTTSPMFVAAHTLVPGDVISAADLRLAEAAVDSAAQLYLEPGAAVEGLVVERTVAAGELIPSSSLVPAEFRTHTTVVVESDGAVPDSLERGDGVQLWATPSTRDDVRADPEVLVADAWVARRGGAEGMLSSGSVELELVVPRDRVAPILRAQADGALLAVIPAEPGR